MASIDLNAFKTSKTFFASAEYGGEKFEIELQTPDLSNIEPTVDGDWGPTYYFSFDEPRSARVLYRNVDGSIENEYSIALSRIVLDSPMIHSDRKKTPLYFRFADDLRGICFGGYMDADGEPTRLAIRQLPLKDKAAPLLFSACPDAR